MLGKLVKYEFKATGRLLLPLYAAFLIMTLITKFFGSINSDATGLVISMGVVIFLYTILIIGLAVMTFIMIIQRFYKNLMTDEGYLMFTLPVPVWQQVVAKMLIGLFWSVIYVIAVGLSALILILNSDTAAAMLNAFNGLNWPVFLQNHGILLCIEILICMLVATMAAMTQIYAAIALGQLSNKHKILMAVVAYIGIAVVQQIVLSLGMLSFSAGAEATGLMTFFAAMDAVDILQWLFNGLTLVDLIFGGIMFAITTYVLKHKLNLE
ncbi:MAG: hypothetical protein Q4C55_01540 [Eubacterium sp.]|nr:hypothetical protein [Eubacterium sp.]